MGYFSDLDIRLQEAGYPSGAELEDELPECPICGSRQIIQGYSEAMSLVQVYCTNRLCELHYETRWIGVDHEQNYAED